MRADAYVRVNTTHEFQVDLTRKEKLEIHVRDVVKERTTNCGVREGSDVVFVDAAGDSSISPFQPCRVRP